MKSHPHLYIRKTKSSRQPGSLSYTARPHLQEGGGGEGRGVGEGRRKGEEGRREVKIINRNMCNLEL